MASSISEKINSLKESIVSIPNYPKKGVLFHDITGLLGDPKLLSFCVETIVEYYRHSRITKVISPEARGFFFGPTIALGLGVGFVPVRKSGKLPGKTISERYELEYGQGELEMYGDAISKDDKALIVDDLLATGGTVEATIKLARRSGCKIEDAAFVVKICDLPGENRLNKQALKCFSLLDL
jgi:adenine phosphoribosyltransferase